jgi:hypothetical protein
MKCLLSAGLEMKNKHFRFSETFCFLTSATIYQMHWIAIHLNFALNYVTITVYRTSWKVRSGAKKKGFQRESNLESTSKMYFRT